MCYIYRVLYQPGSGSGVDSLGCSGDPEGGGVGDFSFAGEGVVGILGRGVFTWGLTGKWDNKQAKYHYANKKICIILIFLKLNISKYL